MNRINWRGNGFQGRAKHSDQMNMCHMKKREFLSNIETLIEREAITVETYTNYRNSGKLYVLNPDLMKSWED